MASGRGCERYAAEEVEGRIYCRQHAKKARERAENRRKAAAR